MHQNRHRPGAREHDTRGCEGEGYREEMTTYTDRCMTGGPGLYKQLEGC